jgi:hypothetical protein
MKPNLEAGLDDMLAHIQVWLAGAIQNDIVLRAGPSAALRVGGDRAPGAGHVLDLVVVRQDQDVAQPGFKATSVGGSPLTIDGPLGQLRQRDERDAQPVVEDAATMGGGRS